MGKDTKLMLIVFFVCATVLGAFSYFTSQAQTKKIIKEVKKLR